MVGMSIRPRIVTFPDGGGGIGRCSRDSPSGNQPRSTSTRRPSSSASGVTTSKPACPSWITLSMRICCAASNVPETRTSRKRHTFQSTTPCGRSTIAVRSATAMRSRSASLPRIRRNCQLPALTNSATAIRAARVGIHAGRRGRVAVRCDARLTRASESGMRVLHSKTVGARHQSRHCHLPRRDRRRAVHGAGVPVSRPG